MNDVETMYYTLGKHMYPPVGQHSSPSHRPVIDPLKTLG